MVPYLDLERSKIYITYIMIGKVEFFLRIPFQIYIRPVHQWITSADWSVDVYLAQIKCLPEGTNHFCPEIVRFFMQNVCLKSLLNIWIYHWWKNGYSHQQTDNIETQMDRSIVSTLDLGQVNINWSVQVNTINLCTELWSTVPCKWEQAERINLIITSRN